MCDFYGKLVGKYTVNRPMDPSHGMILRSLPVSGRETSIFPGNCQTHTEGVAKGSR